MVPTNIFIAFILLETTVSSRELNQSVDAIEITGQTRSYVSGPISGNFLLSRHDTIQLYAGELPPLPNGSTSEIRIRKWAIWDGGESEIDSLCALHRIYDYGRIAVFLCPNPGTHVALVMDSSVSSRFDIDTPPVRDGSADEFTKIWYQKIDLEHFIVKPIVGIDEFNVVNAYGFQDFYPNVVLSDPFEIIPSEFCYYWNYRLTEKARVGFLFRESDHLVGTAQGSTYILMDLEIWVGEPVALIESERKSYKSTLQPVSISSYSKTVTTKFDAKGLFPCLRRVHPSVEIGDIKFWEKTQVLDSPHWKVEIKIHTNTLISQLTDVSWTISSRQHIALFHCFVGDVRVFVNVQDFGFVPEGLSDRTSVQWERSSVAKTIFDYLKLKIKHVYGHPTAYVGQSSNRKYQPGHLRTDLVVVNNPCVAQEFAIATSGRVYVVEEFLTDFFRNVHSVILPGFGNIDAEGKFKEVGPESNKTVVEDIEESIRRHKTFLKIADFAITPTHIALLMDDSTIYLHSRSAYYKGLAYISSTKKDRIATLVKRRWCGVTNFPKTDNMIIPAYSPKGNIIILQIYPVETLATVLPIPSSSCLGKDADFFEKSVDETRKTINESCIHRDDAISRSDERGLPDKPDLTACEGSDNNLPINTSYVYGVDPSSKKSFLLNQGKMFSGSDPHYPSDLRNIAMYKTNDDNEAMKSHNKAFTFHVDSPDGSPILSETLLKNGLRLIDNEINLHSMDFTPLKNHYLIGVQFFSREFNNIGLKSIMITTLLTRNMPSQIFPVSDEIEETLDVAISFPGVVLARKSLYKIRNMVDEKSNNSNDDNTMPYVTKIFPINNAVPSYVVDLGNVFVFSSVESKYARPLSFFSREYIRELQGIIKLELSNSSRTVLEGSERNPVFNFATTRSNLFDIVVTEHGIISVLKRRPMANRNETDAQTVFLGSIITQDALREVRPFATKDQIFQLATPDGEIVYGKFKTQYLYPACEQSWIDEIAKTGNFSVVQTTCLMPHNDANLPPYCVSKPLNDNCIPWIYLDDKAQTKTGDPSVDKVVIGKCETFNHKSPGKPPKTPQSCIAPVIKSENEEELPPDNSPNSEIVSAEILNVPFHSVIIGSLQSIEEDNTDDLLDSDSSRDATRKLCPFSSFDIDYQHFEYAEVGFKTRVTAQISYRGKLTPSEAELIVEYENIPGVEVEINSSDVQENDQTTVIKTIDITFRLANINMYNMRKKKLKTHTREQINLAKENTDIFSLTIRPSIVNLRCNKEEFFATLQFTTGCNPFNKMRFIAEVSPVKRHAIKYPGDEDYNEEVGFRRVDDYLEVNRDDVWHKQRERFKCERREVAKCQIPFAYLYEDNVFDISWRDPFVPQFEQFLRSHSREITGNIVMYDLFGFDIVMNTTNLDAGCFHTAADWYNTLLQSVKSIGLDTSEQEDIYHYYIDCFDHSILQRNKPKVLASSEYRLINATNHNRLRFDIADASNSFRRTKNRNQFLLFRAVVINTGFNRFTYCKLMDTFFLVRIVGMQAPRKGLSTLAYGGIVLGLVVFLGIVYCVFAYCYTWKLDVANLDTNPDDELLDDDNDFEYQEDRKFAKEVKDQHRWKSAVTKIQAVSRIGKHKGRRKNKK